MDLGADFQDYRDLQLPLCILQLDPADRAVLRIAGKSVVNESSVCSIVQAFIVSSRKPMEKYESHFFCHLQISFYFHEARINKSSAFFGLIFFIVIIELKNKNKNLIFLIVDLLEFLQYTALHDLITLLLAQPNHIMQFSVFSLLYAIIITYLFVITYFLRYI